MRFKLHARFCTLICSLCALMILSGCGQQVASSIGWDASENTSGTGKTAAAISSSSTAGVFASAAAKQKQAAVDGGNKAVAGTGKAAASAPMAKQAARKPVRPPTLINIGSRKQLFIDDYLLESFRDTTRVLNPAEKSDANPILRADKPWEGREVRVDAVIYEEQEKLFRMWYSSDAGICLATSKDGVHWEKPVLGLVEYKGSRQNNILPPEQVKTYFFKDLHEADPFLDEASGHEALPSELGGFLLVHAVSFANFFGFALEVDHARHFHLHAVGQLVTFHASFEVGVFRVLLGMALVEEGQFVQGLALVLA